MVILLDGSQENTVIILLHTLEPNDLGTFYFPELSVPAGKAQLIFLAVCFNNKYWLLPETMTAYYILVSLKMAVLYVYITHSMSCQMHFYVTHTV